MTLESFVIALVVIVPLAIIVWLSYAAGKCAGWFIGYNEGWGDKDRDGATVYRKLATNKTTGEKCWHEWFRIRREGRTTTHALTDFALHNGENYAKNNATDNPFNGGGK